MAFKLKTSLVSATPSIEYFEGNKNEAFIYGEGLSFTDGKLTKCSATVKPDFISLGDVYCKEAKTLVPVMRVFDFQLFECSVSGDITSVSAGDIVTLDEKATGVSTQTSGGVAEIISVDKDTVTVKF